MEPQKKNSEATTAGTTTPSNIIRETSPRRKLRRRLDSTSAEEHSPTRSHRSPSIPTQTVAEQLNDSHLRKLNVDATQLSHTSHEPIPSCSYHQDIFEPPSDTTEDLSPPLSPEIQHLGRVTFSATREVIFYDRAISVKKSATNKEIQVVEYDAANSKCRFCSKERSEKEEELVNVCKCSDGMRFAHGSCLRKTVENSITRCQKCNHEFRERRAIEVGRVREERSFILRFVRCTRGDTSTRILAILFAVGIIIIILAIMEGYRYYMLKKKIRCASMLARIYGTKNLKCD